MQKLVSKAVKTLEEIFKEELKEEFDEHIKEAKDIILEEYDQLPGYVRDRNSRTNPGLPRIRDAFVKELEEFEMLSVEDTSLNIISPDMENFNFNTGIMKVIENILEGTAGIYVEIDAEQYEQMYGKKPIGLQAFDDTARKKDMIYIIRYTADVRRRERESLDNNQRLVRYPFSNTPPIHIFDSANDYIEDNIEDWIDTALDRAMKRFKRDYRG